MKSDPILPAPEEEVAHLDDQVIGRAFKISIVAFLLIVMVAAGVFVYVNRPKAAPPARVTKLGAPAVSAAQPREIPAVKFTDITAEAGIKFKHNNGAYGD